jgi:hypothetical protein
MKSIKFPCQWQVISNSKLFVCTDDKDPKQLITLDMKAKQLKLFNPMMACKHALGSIDCISMPIVFSTQHETMTVAAVVLVSATPN